MGLWVKRIGIACAVLIAGLLCVALLTFGVMRNGVAPAGGEAKLAALSAGVAVTRDDNGVPHIDARTKRDALAALGFAHAQDRLWQMEVLRMSGQGRLSEMFGEATVDVDVFLRTLGFLPQVQSSFEVLSDDAKAELVAFASGVNAWMSRETGILSPRLPPEFLILGHDPEPWAPEHSLLILKIMSLQLSMNMDREISRLKLAAAGLAPTDIQDILPPHRDDDPPPLPDIRELYDLKPPSLPKKAAQRAIPRELFDRSGHFASNNWVIAGSRTESGKPLLANDPHLSFTAPSLWYLARLSWDASGERTNAVGATIPGVPAIVLGRNDRVAWGFTNAGADVQDLFIEQFDPQDGNRVRTPDGFAPLESRTEIIRIGKSEQREIDVRTSRHGPLLPGSFKGLSDVLPPTHAAALAWTGLSSEDRSYEVVSGLSDARSVTGFQQGLDLTVSPQQVVVVADIDGNIGMSAPAAIPLRTSANTLMGRAPAPGWDARFDWQGTVPISALPTFTNPSNGALGSANSRLMGASADPFLTFDWDEVFRQDRVFDHVLDPMRKSSMDSMIAGQTDSVSKGLLALRDVLVAAVPEQADPLIVRLQNWNGDMDASGIEPLVMTAFHRELLDVVFADELGGAIDVIHTRPLTALLRVFGEGSARDWCDDATTEERETCKRAASKAFEMALADLSKRYGEDRANWRWGRAHTVFNEHRPFSSVWPLSLLFDVERETSGGAYTLRRGKTDFKDEKHPFRAVHGAGYRAIYDFADLDASLYMQTTGQSGNPFSHHYDDLADLWADGRYITIPSRAPEADDDRVWRLRPAD